LRKEGKGEGKVEEDVSGGRPGMGERELEAGHWDAVATNAAG